MATEGESATHWSDRSVIRVLGAVDLVCGGREVTVKGRLERMLLAALVLSANHTVSFDQLAEILWGPDPPPSRDNTLQTHVFRLRRALGHGRITREDHSYRLTVERREVDALLFEDAVGYASDHRGDPEQCLQATRRALRLWRGPSFGEFAERDPFRLEAIRLDELRMYAMELQLEAELALDHAEVVVSKAEPLVEEYPYRERLWYLLISALSRSGRRVEALRGCQRLRDVLAEVGLDPSLQLRELEEEVASEDPAVSPRLHTGGG